MNKQPPNPKGMRSLDRSLPLKLLKAREAVMEQFRPNLNAHGVTEQQWRVLRALAEHQRMDAGELARVITLRMPSLSRIMVDLEERGLIAKRRSTEDRRLVDVEITEDGTALYFEISAQSEHIYKDLEARIGREAYRRLITALDDVTEKLANGNDRS